MDKYVVCKEINAAVSYTLPLHDALPISPEGSRGRERRWPGRRSRPCWWGWPGFGCAADAIAATGGGLGPAEDTRSGEHTSELQSTVHLVCRLLLEKKK